MKKIFLIIGLSVVSIFAQAEDDVCEIVSEHAEFIMDARQSGMAASTLINAAEETFGDEAALAIHMISLAFDEPRYNNQNDKQQAVEEFTSMTYLECYKELKSMN